MLHPFFDSDAGGHRESPEIILSVSIFWGYKIRQAEVGLAGGFFPLLAQEVQGCQGRIAVVLILKDLYIVPGLPGWK